MVIYSTFVQFRNQILFCTNDRHYQVQYSRHFHLGVIATVYQCELFVIQMGCIWAKKTVNNPSYIVFLSDSFARNSPQVTPRVVLDTIDQLNEPGSFYQFMVRWVPGNVKISENRLRPFLGSGLLL